MKYTAEEVRKSADWLYLWERKAGARKARAMLTAYAERIEADEVAVPMGWLAADGSGRVIDAKAKDAGKRSVATGSATAVYSIPLFPHPPAQAAQGEASLGRCKACGRATRAVCDGLDGNGLGCTNAPPIDIAAVRKVIAHLRQFDSPYTRGLADKLEAAIKGVAP